MAKNLIKVSTYARNKGVSVAYIYKLIRQKKIVSVVRYGMKMIDTSKSKIK